MKTHEIIFTTSHDPPIVPLKHVDNCAIETTDDVLYLGARLIPNYDFLNSVE